jgi:hypothetical protein
MSSLLPWQGPAGGRFDLLRPRIAYICSIYTLIQRVPLLIVYENCYNAIEGLDSG